MLILGIVIILRKCAYFEWGQYCHFFINDFYYSIKICHHFMGTMTLTRLKSAKIRSCAIWHYSRSQGINGHPEVKKYFFWCQNASPRDYDDNDIILRKLRKKGGKLIIICCIANFSLSATRLSRYFCCSPNQPQINKKCKIQKYPR